MAVSGEALFFPQTPPDLHPAEACVNQVSPKRWHVWNDVCVCVCVSVCPVLAVSKAGDPRKRKKGKNQPLRALCGGLPILVGILSSTSHDWRCHWLAGCQSIVRCQIEKPRQGRPVCPSLISGPQTSPLRWLRHGPRSASRGSLARLRVVCPLTMVSSNLPLESLPQAERVASCVLARTGQLPS